MVSYSVRTSVKSFSALVLDIHWCMSGSENKWKKHAVLKLVLVDIYVMFYRCMIDSDAEISLQEFTVNGLIYKYVVDRIM